jgi:exopolyphosphatase
VPSVTASIEDYLRWAGRRLEGGLTGAAGLFPGGLTVVQGSPAADLDSLAGSAAYAFLLHREQLAGRGRRAETLVLPRMTITSEELRLRPEAPKLFRRAGIAVEALIDRDALDPASVPAERLSVVLIDTDGGDLPAPLRRRVVEILDHHEGSPGRPRAEREILAPVGSACTLVAEQILLRLPSLLNPGLAVLLLGPVLLDTVNLDPGAGRVTERDRRAAVRLTEIAGSMGRGLYGELRQARTRLDGLSANDLLRRDYKQGEAGGLRYGIASVPLSACDWARRGDPGACLWDTVARQRLDLLAVLFAYEGQGGNLRRELLLWVRGSGRYRTLRRYLDAFPLDLHALPEPPLAPGATGERRGGGKDATGAGPRSRGSADWEGGLLELGQRGFSRKRLEPELRRFLESATREEE